MYPVLGSSAAELSSPTGLLSEQHCHSPFLHHRRERWDHGHSVWLARLYQRLGEGIRIEVRARWNMNPSQTSQIDDDVANRL